MPRLDILVSADRLSRDLRASAKTLSDEEARFLVDAYYIMQDQRIRTEGQVRALADSKEPHQVIRWLAQQSRMLEDQVKGALDRYTSAHPVGQWMKNSVKGIGPVISAGLLAHIDIARAPTAGHIMRFAGLDPTVVWQSSDYVRGRVSVLRKERDEWVALLDACDELGRKKPFEVLRATDHIQQVPTPERALAVCQRLTGLRVKPKAVFHADNIVRELMPKDRLAEAYQALTGDVKLDWKEIIRALTKRPWNADLKKLMFLVGESFVKVSGGDDPGYYGTIYKQRKEQEIARNERGLFADQAAATLEKKKYRADTVAKKHYMAGTLPPAHIHRRATRYAAKRFIYDLHTVWYWLHYKRLPPLPYVITHGGHAHYEISGGFDSVPGLREALEKRSPVVAPTPPPNGRVHKLQL